MVEKVALVTGAAGIGGATSRRLSRDATAIGVPDISGESAGKVAIDIAAAGGKAIGLTSDAFSREWVRAAVNDLRAAFEPVTILVKNAGITGFVPFLEISFEREEMNPRFQTMVEAGPIRRHGDEDVADAVAWLISDEAGQVIGVNGGRYV